MNEGKYECGAEFGQKEMDSLGRASQDDVQENSSTDFYVWIP